MNWCVAGRQGVLGRAGGLQAARPRDNCAVGVSCAPPPRPPPRGPPARPRRVRTRRLQSLRSNLASRQQKKRAQPDGQAGAGRAAPAHTGDDGSELCATLPGAPDVGGGSAGSSDDELAEFASRPKRRSVSVDLAGFHGVPAVCLGAHASHGGRGGSVDIRVSVDATSGLHRRASTDRRTSLDAWHEARRQRCAGGGGSWGRKEGGVCAACKAGGQSAARAAGPKQLADGSRAPPRPFLIPTGTRWTRTGRSQPTS
jgi:hypothetical protein